MDPTWAITIIALVIAVVVTVAYKFMTDQKLMKALKEDLKKLQKKMKESRDKPDQMMTLQKEAMEKNMKLMSHSMRPSLITLIPIFFLFGWMNANLTYVPIDAAEPFSIDVFTDAEGDVLLEILPAGVEIMENTVSTTNKQATFNLEGDPGAYTIRATFNEVSEEADLLIGEGYSTPENRFKSSIKKINIGYEKLKVNLLGFEMGWLMAYIILSIVFSVVIRKIFRIY